MVISQRGKGYKIKIVNIKLRTHPKALSLQLYKTHSHLTNIHLSIQPITIKKKPTNYIIYFRLLYTLLVGIVATSSVAVKKIWYRSSKRIRAKKNNRVISQESYVRTKLYLFLKYAEFLLCLHRK